MIKRGLQSKENGGTKQTQQESKMSNIEDAIAKQMACNPLPSTAMNSAAKGLDVHLIRIAFSSSAVLYFSPFFDSRDPSSARRAPSAQTTMN